MSTFCFLFCNKDFLFVGERDSGREQKLEGGARDRDPSRRHLPNNRATQTFKYECFFAR